MTRYAKVRFPSALPQLDKEFDYVIPDGMELSFGQMVSVPFGSKRSLKSGVVVGFANESNFGDKVLGIDSIEIQTPLLTRQQLDLAIAVASRQAGSVGELLSTILPKRFKRAEASYVPAETSFSESPRISSTATSRIFSDFDYTIDALGIPAWARDAAHQAKEELEQGRSSLVVLPDYRAVELFQLALERLDLSKHSIKHESSDTGSQRYINYLRALDEVAINFGVRSTVFIPAKNLGLIVLLDDADESHVEQSAPYWNSREVLLQRQELEGTRMLVLSHSPSAEFVRLVDLGYFQRAQIEIKRPISRVTDNHTRLDDESFGFISNCLRSGKPVLIQTANLGQASAVACRKCRELRLCPSCSGRLWVDSAKTFRCRSCKFHGAIGSCSCGGVEVSTAKLGSSGLAASLAKAFPEAMVIHSSGAEKMTSVPTGPTLVIATVGAEPIVPGGYACVLIADAYSMVAGSRLRSLEQSGLRWANAATLTSSDGLVIFVGLTGEIAEQAKQLNFYSMIEDDYKDRIELGLPPAVRLMSITSTSRTDLNVLSEELHSSDLASQLKKLPSESNKLVFTYPYSIGSSLASELAELSVKVSLKSKFRKPGQRLFRICMDDASVL